MKDGGAGPKYFGILSCIPISPSNFDGQFSYKIVLGCTGLSVFNSSRIFGKSKALGEGTMTIEALNYIQYKKLEYENLFKISGRYWLSEKFDYNRYNNNSLVFKKINGNVNNIFTSFYKIPSDKVNKLLNFLKDSEISMKRKIGYEVLFGYYLKHIDYNNVKFIDTIGYQGQVTVCGSHYVG